jgi:precorrin-6A/cobalt-precorrin-6A reductase
MARRILILGGTTEARALAATLASRSDLAVTASLAGRTESIAEHAVPVRIGGFGGAAGLAEYLRKEKIDALVDATHPYAAIISQNAAEAAKAAGVPLLALRRPPWASVTGDRWTEVDDVTAAVAALGSQPRRVFLALGRKEIAPFATAPQHFYLVRSVDPVEMAGPNVGYVVERGPFSLEGDRALLQRHRIDVIVSRNSGGSAAYGKIAAARELGVEVILLRRPVLPDVSSVESVEAVVEWLDHAGARSTERGV